MPSPNNELPLGQALALGVLQGPAELLPISSSAHTSVLSWLLEWDYTELEPQLRKSFEVALHAGAAAALVTALRRELGAALKPQSTLVIAAASAPPALAGYAFEEMIERRLGTPATIAAGLLAGSAAMVLADRAPQRRTLADASTQDGLILGLAQACALVPGVSRAGATLAAARMLHFRSADAKLLSDQVALPVLAGAASLRVARLRRRGLERGIARAFTVGAIGSFASTLLSAAVLRRGRHIRRLGPYAAYRALLAGWIFIRVRQAATAPRPERARA